MVRKEKNRKILVIIFAVIVTLSMVGSIFGIILDNYQTNKLKYGKFSFTATDTGLYNVKINGKVTSLNYYPTELERIPVDASIKDKLLTSQAMMILFDPVKSNDSLEFIDYIRYDMQNQLPKMQMGFGILSPTDKYSLPVLSCENASASLPFIIINDSGNTSITVDPNNTNCIIMNARLKEVVAAEDRLVYVLDGVMN